ncbi:MAG: hypothetical protein KF858_02205 [Candidatus Sumerlaeia bacterium]|nr:hypothetical protein [Candidatus Sumerlaeia bacterium]
MFSSVSKRCAAGLAAMLVAGVLAGCAGSRLKAEDIPVDVKAAYTVSPGQSRKRVESVLGMPTAIAPAKGGNTYAQYQYGTVVRSVVYDANNRVVVAYP